MRLVYFLLLFGKDDVLIQINGGGADKIIVIDCI